MLDTELSKSVIHVEKSDKICFVFETSFVCLKTKPAFDLSH